MLDDPFFMLLAGDFTSRLCHLLDMLKVGDDLNYSMCNFMQCAGRDKLQHVHFHATAGMAVTASHATPCNLWADVIAAYATLCN